MNENAEVKGFKLDRFFNYLMFIYMSLKRRLGSSIHYTYLIISQCNRNTITRLHLYQDYLSAPRLCIFASAQWTINLITHVYSLKICWYALIIRAEGVRPLCCKVEKQPNHLTRLFTSINIMCFWTVHQHNEPSISLHFCYSLKIGLYALLIRAEVVCLLCCKGKKPT